jgi:outer membrane protein assembly factor BamB
MVRHLVIGLVLFVGSGQQLLAADNWPQWRGPLGNGVAADGDYPVEFSDEAGVLWKAPLPGSGSSTPAVWGDRIFVTCDINGKDGVLCFDMNGNELWRKELGQGVAGKHRNASGSNPSPATDGKCVVSYFKSGEVACHDIEGNKKWRINLQERNGENTLWWDLGTSPLLAGDKVVIAVIQDGDSYLTALDLKTGSEVWKQTRKYKTEKESDQSYSTPQIVKIDGQDVIVTWGANHLTGHELATGKPLWECGGFNPQNEGYWRTIASVAISDGFALVPYGRGKFLAGVRLGGQGDITKSNRLWEKSGTGSDVPTAVARDGKAYLLTDLGGLVCIDIQSGDEVWTAALPKNRNKYYSSPVLAGDKLYCAREDGVVYVGRVSDAGFTQLAENDMGEQVIAMPVPIRGGVLIRGGEHLYMIGTNGAGGK